MWLDVAIENILTKTCNWFLHSISNIYTEQNDTTKDQSSFFKTPWVGIIGMFANFNLFSFGNSCKPNEFEYIFRSFNGLLNWNQCQWYLFQWSTTLDTQLVLVFSKCDVGFLLFYTTYTLDSRFFVSFTVLNKSNCQSKGAPKYLGEEFMMVTQIGTSMLPRHPVLLSFPTCLACEPP